MKTLWITLFIFLLATCSQSRSDDTNPGLPGANHADRKTLTEEECSSKNGKIMGDPGDGRIHRPNYICPSGKPPLGSVRYETGDMIPVEGSVCCPQ